MSSLPYEVLGHIFEYLPQGSIFRCSWVCRSWRIASIGYPRLWRTIDLRRLLYVDNRLVDLHRERSGVLPLVLSTPYGSRGDDLTNPRRISRWASRIEAVSNLTATAFEPEHFTILESAQLIITPKCVTRTISLANTKVRHLSIDLQEHPLYLASDSARKLRTLHLHNQTTDPITLIRLILDMPVLEELALRHFPWQETHDQTAVDDVLENATVIPHLKLISLHNVCHLFLRAFVRPRLLQADTNVLLGQVDPHIRVIRPSYPPKLIPKCVWIDFWQLCLAYGCDNAIIRLEYEALEPTEDYIFPELFTTSEITDIWWYGGSLNSTSLQKFTNLVNMTFEYNPSPPVPDYFNLRDLLNLSLTQNCPQLSYLGILIRKARGSSVAYPDNSPQVVQSFAAFWKYHRHSSFESIRIQDEINRGRWEVARPALEQCVDCFEQGPVFEDLSLPKFPTLRPFFPETLNVDECDTYDGFFGQLWDVPVEHYYTVDQNPVYSVTRAKKKKKKDNGQPSERNAGIGTESLEPFDPPSTQQL